ncbi:CBS domain-containing protein [archaeon]|nr:CBS domain-containing protein [archaeon]
MKNKIFLVLFFLLTISICNAQNYILPTKISGQILAKNIPIENFEITVHYLDISGELQTQTTFTLDKETAIKRRNPSQKGYYFFDEIRAVKGTNIILDLKQTNHNLIIPANPGYSIEVTTISLNFVYQPSSPTNVTEEINYQTQSQNNEEILALINSSNTKLEELNQYEDSQDKTELNYNISKNNPVLINESVQSPTFNNVKKQGSKAAKDIFNIFIVLLIVGVGLVILFLLIKFSTKFFSNTVSKITLSPTKASSRNILNKKVGFIMNSCKKISVNESLHNILAMMSATGSDIVFVVNNNRCIGKIDEKDILKIDLTKKDLMNIQAKEIMSKNVVLIENDKSIEEAFYVVTQENVDVIGITDNNVLEGQISSIDLLQQASKFKGDISKNITARTIMSKNINLIDKKETILHVRDLMLSNNNLFFIVNEEKNHLGTFTAKDFIHSLTKYGNKIQNMSIEQVMHSSITSLKPDLDINQITQIILEKKFKNYPLKFEKEIQGILKLKSVLEIYLKSMQKELI